MEPMQQQLDYFRERIRSAVAARQPLQLRGGGTKDWYGEVPSGAILDTRPYSGVVGYDPTELVITARCGTPLAELEAVLAQHNQMLAFEPPHFGPDATLGGMVAAGLSGPRRQAVGSVRDFVLGTVLMDTRGEVLHFGGQVMKNVAGYDVSRLMAGSMGILALLLEVSLKVLPRPFMEATLQLEASQADAIRMLNEWGGKPLPLSASLWHDGRLLVRLSGATSAVRAAQTMLGGQLLDEEAASHAWQQVREQRHPFFASSPASSASSPASSSTTASSLPCWRLSLPSIAPPLALAGEQLLEWGGALRWLRSDADAATIRAAAGQAGGHATLFSGGDKRAGVFHPLASPVASIQRRLKHSFDPEGIFNPGRLYKDI
ncbi:MAG: glcE [Paucimonas sp.]|nr:glcE [Paucimonas sp.]